MLNQQLEHIVFQDHFFLDFLFFFFNVFVHNCGFYFFKQLNSALLCHRYRGLFINFESLMHLSP